VTGVGPEYVNVIVAHTICVPERSELEIPAILQDSINDGGTYLLEGIEGGKSSALVARAVVSPTSNSVIVRVLNPQKEPIILYQNTKIAVIQELQDIYVAATHKGETTPVEPEKGQMLWEIVQTCQADLSETEKSEFYQFLLEFEDIFADHDGCLGRTSLLKHSINTGTAPPIRQPVRRLSPSKQQEVNQLLDTMLKKDVIQPSCMIHTTISTTTTRYWVCSDPP